jgi:hypothetical protein
MTANANPNFRFVCKVFVWFHAKAQRVRKGAKKNFLVLLCVFAALLCAFA